MIDFPQSLVATILIRATLVLAAAWIVTALLRRAAAATRHAVWGVAFASLLLLPFISLALPRWESPRPTPITPSFMPIQAFVTPDPVVPAAHDHSRVLPSALEQADPAPVRRPPVRPPVLIVLCWTLGAAFGLGRLSAAWNAARRLVRRARAVSPETQALVPALCAQLGIERDVRVLVSDTLTVPVNCGLVRPVILLPASAASWTGERLRVVLLHELAHVRRLDYASLLVMEMVRALYFINPLVWLAAKRADVELERACDDEVLRAGTRGVAYAEHLYEIASALAGARTPRGALAMAQPSTLRARVGAILTAGMNRSPVGLRAMLAVTAVALLFGLPLASLRLLGEGREEAEERAAISALSLPDAAARERAAFALGARTTEAARTALVARLSDPDPTVRGVAAWALGKNGSTRSRDVLVRALKDPEPSVREMAVLALGDLKDARALDALAAMTSDTTMGVRGVLTHALHDIGGSRSADILGGMLLHDGNDHVRDMAAWALRLSAGAVSVPWLIQAMRDANPGVRSAAAQNLAEAADARAFDVLADAAMHDSTSFVRGAASWALGALKDARAVEPLAVAAHDTVWNVRVAATSALGHTPGPRAIDALIALTRDPVHQVRLTAVEALGTHK